MWNISVFADEVYDGDAGFEPALALLQRVGVEYTDLRLVNGYDSFMNVSDAELDHVQRLLKKYDVKVAGLGTPLFKCPLHGSVGPAWGNHHSIGTRVSYEHYLDLMPRAFALADRFETDNIRCFSFWRENALDNALDEIAEKLGRAAEIAGAAGRMLYLENEHNTMAGTGVELARILKAIDSPNITGIYDDGNSGRIGGIPFPDDYEAMRGLIGHIHFKFQRLEVLCGWPSPARINVEPSRRYPPCCIWSQPETPFKGEIRIGAKTFEIKGQRTFQPATHSAVGYHRNFLRALKRDGYRGVLAIDTGFEGLRKRRGRENIGELEADVGMVVESLRQLITEVWAEE